MRIVVYCPNLIGDTVMATPILRALRQAYPEAWIDAILKPNVAPTLDAAPWIDGRLLFDPRSSAKGLSARALVRTLRGTRYDLGLLLPNSFRSAWLFWRGQVARRVGYARGGRGILLTDSLRAPASRGRFLPTPAVEYYAALSRLAGAPVTSLRPELFTTEADERAADTAWSDLGLGTDRPVVLLNTGGAFGPAKSWPAESFARLARRLADDAGADVVVLCGPAERDAARSIASQAAHPRVASLADQPLSIGLSKACVRRAALLVTTDSGPRHFAAALGVPVVSLFGPTHIAWTRTYHPHATHLQQPVPCGPCQQPVCPEGHHRCMRELDPETVYRAAVQWLPARGRAPHLHTATRTQAPCAPGS